MLEICINILYAYTLELKNARLAKIGSYLNLHKYLSVFCLFIILFCCLGLVPEQKGQVQTQWEDPGESEDSGETRGQPELRVQSGG